MVALLQSAQLPRSTKQAMSVSLLAAWVGWHVGGSGLQLSRCLNVVIQSVLCSW